MTRTISLFALMLWLVPRSFSAELGSETDPNEVTFVVRSIGQVETGDGSARIVLDRTYQPGLLGLQSFSHIYVYWWFDKSDSPGRRATLQVHPRGNPKNPLAGVFATRSPARPNLIAMTLCKVKSIMQNIVEVESIDAFDGTPVLDIKPFLPGYDSSPNAKVPDWVHVMVEPDHRNRQSPR